MAKRLVLILVLVLAVAAGWFLLRPLPHAQRAPSVAQATQTPEPAATVSEAPATTPPAASPTGTATPSPVPPAPGGPKLAIIVDDCGQWVDIERGFIALPVPLTLSVLPHVHAAATIAQEAHDAGKGVMLHLPMETVSGMYPGPGEVTTEMTDAQIASTVDDDLAQVPLAQGVNNHEGSKGSADERVMRDVVAALQKHGGLFFIDSRTSAASVAQTVAANAGMPTASRDVFLDNQETVAYTETMLRQAMAIALRRGSAIAIGHPRKTTLEAVTAMLPEIRSAGITLVLAQSLTH